MDRAEWLEFAVEYLRAAHKAAKTGLHESQKRSGGYPPTTSMTGISHPKA